MQLLRSFFGNNLVFVYVFIQYFTMLLSALYIGDLKRSKVFFLGVLLISLACSASYYYINVLSTIIFTFLAILFIYFYTKKISKAILLPVSTLLLYICTDYVSDFIIKYFFHLREVSDTIGMIKLTIAFLPFVMFAKYFYSYLQQKTFHKKLIQAGMIISITTLVMFFAVLIIERFVETNTYMGTTHSIFIFGYGLVSALIFQVVLFSFEKEAKIKEKQRELRHLHLYVTELEKHYTEMRRFRHDYKNILLSLGSYIEEKDFDGLKQYFNTNIKQVSATMFENNFTLAKLSNIDSKAVKFLLANKLVLAQELGVNTDIEIYNKIAEDQLNTWKLDELSLVRALGIIMDNAIEASADVEDGLLRVTMFSEGNTIHIVVANSCDQYLPPLFQLNQEGYSTKGKERGLGLSNLNRIVAQEKHLTLDTKINQGLFTQILSIGV